MSMQTANLCSRATTKRDTWICELLKRLIFAERDVSEIQSGVFLVHSVGYATAHTRSMLSITSNVKYLYAYSLLLPYAQLALPTASRLVSRWNAYAIACYSLA